jgi:hypothetical protein
MISSKKFVANMVFQYKIVALFNIIFLNLYANAKMSVKQADWHKR